MSGYRRCGAPIAALLGFFIVTLDTTVVNVALARAGGDLGVPVASLQRVVDIYALTLAALQPSAGAACDRLGVRNIHLLGLVVFGLLPTARALAPVSGALIAFRALQDVGAAAIVPASLAMLSLIHDRPADRVRAIGLQGGAGGVVAAAGPVAGGLLVIFTGWWLVLWVSLLLTAVALWLTARRPPVPGARSLRRYEGGDLLGQVLSVAELVATTYGIIAVGEHGWNSSIVASTLAGLSLLVVFVLTERTASRPMLPTAIFSRSRFAVAAVVGFALNTGFFGRFLVLALSLQCYLGYEPRFADLVLAPQACSAITASPMGGRMTAGIGASPTMLTGLLTGATGFAGLAVVTAPTPYPLVVALTFLGGFGAVPTMPAATSAAAASVPAGYTGVAGSVINAARQTGSVVSVTVLGSLIALGDFLTGLHRAIVGVPAAFAVAAIPVVAVVLRAAGRPERVDAS